MNVLTKKFKIPWKIFYKFSDSFFLNFGTQCMVMEAEHLLKVFLFYLCRISFSVLLCTDVYCILFVNAYIIQIYIIRYVSSDGSKISAGKFLFVSYFICNIHYDHEKNSYVYFYISNFPIEM